MKKQHFYNIFINKLYKPVVKLVLFVILIFPYQMSAFIIQEDNTILNNDSTISGEISFQPENNEVLTKHVSKPQRIFVGTKLGLTSGSGVSFGIDRAFDEFSFEMNTFVLKTSNLSVYSIGGSVKYALLDDEKRHIYVNYGLSYNYWSSKENNNVLESPFRTGLGLGYMQFFSNNFSYDVSILATYFTGDGTIYPIPQIGIQYHFRD